MIRASLDRPTLEQDAWRRRDVAASFEQEEETRRLGFRHARVLLSKTRLRAEVYLQQN